MNTAELGLRRSHVLGVLFANAILWVAAILLTRNHTLGGLAVVGLISIGSLMLARHRGG